MQNSKYFCSALKEFFKIFSLYIFQVTYVSQLIIRKFINDSTNILLGWKPNVICRCVRIHLLEKEYFIYFWQSERAKRIASKNKKSMKKVVSTSFPVENKEIEYILASVSFWPLLIIESVAHMSQHVPFMHDLLIKQV